MESVIIRMVDNVFLFQVGFQIGCQYVLRVQFLLDQVAELFHHPYILGIGDNDLFDGSSQDQTILLSYSPA